MPAAHPFARTTRALALALAVLALAFAPSGGAATPSPAPAPLAPPGDWRRETPVGAGEHDPAGRSTTTGGVVVMGASAFFGALTVWQWGWSDSYVDFMLGDDPGPLIDPTIFYAPPLAVGLAATGGAAVLRGVAMQRGLAADVPWTYWLGLAPAAVALGAEVALFAFIDGPSATADTLIAAGTASSVLCLWGSTAWHAAHLQDGAASAMDATAGTARSPMIFPLLGFRAGVPSVGLALSGEY